MGENHWFGITHGIILVNLVAFMMQVFVWNESFINQYVLTSEAVLAQQQYIVLLFSSVLHASPEHLIMNMVFLFFLGRICEIAYGHIVTGLIYVSAVVVGGLAFIFLFPEQSAVGASGGVFGLAGAAMFGAPERSLFDNVPVLELLALPLIRNFSSAIVISTVFLVLPNLLNAFNLADNVAHISHIGGLAAGAAYAFILKHENAKKGFVAFIVFGSFVAILLMDPAPELKMYAIYGMVVAAVLLRLLLALF